MRGKASVSISTLGTARITPAYAGKRRSLCVTWRAWRDHPRVCGEKESEHRHARFRLGSPPRMRGKGIPTTRQSRRSGITPAYAGKSIRLNFYARYCQDHPRVCGEKTFTVRNVEGVEGSPPRMRGKGSATIISQRLGGITPAYAGKSKTGRLHCAVRPDHPRVCGEKLTASPYLRL